MLSSHPPDRTQLLAPGDYDRIAELVADLGDERRLPPPPSARACACSTS